MRMQRLATLALLTLVGTSAAFAKSDEEEKREKQREVHADREHARVVESQGCPAGTFSIVTSPDGNSVSVLFDNFVVSTTTSNFVRKTCAMEIPLHLPAGYSLGIYQLDYRGFAHLGDRQRGELQVNYGTGEGERNRGRRMHNDLKGAYDGDFIFNDRLRGGILRRMGCGASAVLNFAATLTVNSKESKGPPAEGRMTLDTVDGTPEHGLVFGLNLKKCGEPDND
jgi:Domain of unknown function (DUF4360)